MSRILQRDYSLEIAKGKVPKHSFIHKFGEAGDIDIADNFVDIWDGCVGTMGMAKTPNYTYSAADDIDSLVSSNAGDAVDIDIYGLDASWDLVVQTITLDGQDRVALDTDLIRVFRMINVGASALAGDVYCYVNGGGLTAGVPDTDADIRAAIQIGNEQTLMALYTVPNGKTGYLDMWYASNSRKKNQISDIELRIRPFGEVLQLKHRSTIQATGTSHVMHLCKVPEVIPAKSDIALRADSNANDGAVSGGFDIVLVDD